MGRTVAAAIPVKNQIWFIKALDTPERLEGFQASIAQIVRDMKFPNPDEPEFVLPDGWEQRPGGGMSRMNLRCNLVSPPISFAVTVLSKPEADWEKYLRDNFNRWRDQLTLVPHTLKDLLTQVQTIDRGQGNESAYVVDWSGKSPLLGRMLASSGGSMMGSPSMGSMGAPKDVNPSLTPTTPPSAAATTNSLLGPQIKIPLDWIAIPVSTFQLAKFSIGNSADPGEVVVSAATNDLKTNSKMWQQQVLPEDAGEPLVQERADQAIAKGEAFPITNGEGKLYLFQESEAEDGKALLIAILPMDEKQSLYVKMRGSNRLIAKSRQSLIEFATSISVPQ